MSPAEAALTVVVLFAVLAVAEAALWPYARCRHCDGGRHGSPLSASWSACGRCGGSGKRVRALAKILRKDLR